MLESTDVRDLANELLSELLLFRKKHVERQGCGVGGKISDLSKISDSDSLT